MKMGITDIIKQLFGSTAHYSDMDSDLNAVESQPYDYTTSISYRLDNLEKAIYLITERVSKLEEIKREPITPTPRKHNKMV